MEISNYEFNTSENESIKKLINQMTFVSIFLIILGALYAAFGISNLVAAPADVSAEETSPFIKFIFNLVLATVFIVMGLVTVNSANSFRLVVKTEGNDIENLMKALDKLTTWFSIQTMMIIIGIILLILGLIF